jgi:hypothetical protein
MPLCLSSCRRASASSPRPCRLTGRGAYSDEDILNKRSGAATRDWAAAVLAQLTAVLEQLDTTFEVHAGSSYRNCGVVEELRRRGAIVQIPAEHSVTVNSSRYGHSGEGAGVLQAPTFRLTLSCLLLRRLGRRAAPGGRLAPDGNAAVMSG